MAGQVTDEDLRMQKEQEETDLANKAKQMNILSQ